MKNMSRRLLQMIEKEIVTKKLNIKEVQAREECGYIRSLKTAFVNDDLFVRFHEIGHHFYYAYHGNVDIEEIENLATSYEEATYILKQLKSEFGTDKEGISVLSDVVYMRLRRIRPNGFLSHDPSYVEMKGVEIIPEEAFADFFGIIASENINGLKLMTDLFPKFTESFQKFIESIG